MTNTSNNKDPQLETEELEDKVIVTGLENRLLEDESFEVHRKTKTKPFVLFIFLISATSDSKNIPHVHLEFPEVKRIKSENLQ